MFFLNIDIIPGGTSSQDLLRVVLNLYDSRECDNLFKKAQKPGLLAKTPQGISMQSMVCAWERGKDTCQVSLILYLQCDE